MNERDLMDHQERYGEEEDAQEQEGDRDTRDFFPKFLPAQFSNHRVVDLRPRTKVKETHTSNKTIHVPVEDQRDKLERVLDELERDGMSAVEREAKPGTPIDVKSVVESIRNYLKAKL